MDPHNRRRVHVGEGVCAKRDHGRRATAGDVCPRRVDDVCQVRRGMNFSINFLPNSRFMKRVGRDRCDASERGIVRFASERSAREKGTASEYFRWQVV